MAPPRGDAPEAERSPESSGRDSDDEEGIDFELDDPFDVRGGVGAEELQRLAREMQAQGPRRAGGQAHAAAAADTDEESTKDAGSGDEGFDEEGIEFDMDDPFEVRGGDPACLAELRQLAAELRPPFACNSAAAADRPPPSDAATPAAPSGAPARRFGPAERGRRQLELELKPLTPKVLGQVRKVHACAGGSGDLGDGAYEEAMAASDYTRVGYSSGLLVCCVCCRLEPRSHDEGGSMVHVEAMDVLKAYRRRRMATQMLEWVLQQASGAGVAEALGGAPSLAAAAASAAPPSGPPPPSHRWRP
ncbi:unnamed protein product [Prorocentrum cordatum]|uniref:N-acetyltransferase domain-containing protein n=1 Tax=Prorocentrum cordatum TaxID=2364126 RepID=A0ABN9UBU0_9DINO|nr:unnamed protein product [Polarella glacialis]